MDSVSYLEIIAVPNSLRKDILNPVCTKQETLRIDVMILATSGSPNGGILSKKIYILNACNTCAVISFLFPVLFNLIHAVYIVTVPPM